MNWHIVNISQRVENYDHVKRGCLSSPPIHRCFIELQNDEGEKIYFSLNDLPKCLMKGRNRAEPFDISEIILELI